MTQQLEKRFFQAAPSLQKREEQKSVVIEGYAALFNVRTVIWGLFEESIKPGAFSRAISEKHDTRWLFNHDPNIILGRTKNGTLLLREDKLGLWTETTPPDTQQAHDVVENIRVGNVDQMSFAFIPRKMEWTFSEERDVLDHCEVCDLDLMDVSGVVFPAYKETSVGIRSVAEDLHRKARQEWERARCPAAPVVVRGIDPRAVLIEVGVRRRRRL